MFLFNEMGFHSCTQAYNYYVQCQASVGVVFKYTATGLWCSGNIFSGMVNHTSLSGSLIDEAGFGRCQENVGMQSANSNVWWRRDNSLGLSHLVPVKGNVNSTTYRSVVVKTT